jgi:SPP1 family predicted phage head-tail adaptor
MRAGRLDRSITIQRKSVTLSDSGDQVVTWVDVATVPADKIENRGAERFAAQQIVGHAVKTFRIRWSQTVAEISTLHRLLFEGRNFDITDVREIGRREGIEIDCYAASEAPLVAAS